MQTELVYDITQQDSSEIYWLMAAAGVFALALAAWFYQRRQGRTTGVHGFFVVMIGVALLAVSATVWDQRRLVAKLQTGDVTVAEGPVQAYALQQKAVYNTGSKRYDRATWESFHVGGTAFIYRRSGGGGAGFHNGSEPPLAISDGVLLRLHYVEDVEGDRSQRRILRLERLCATPCRADVR